MLRNEAYLTIVLTIVIYNRKTFVVQAIGNLADYFARPISYTHKMLIKSTTGADA